MTGHPSAPADARPAGTRPSPARREIAATLAAGVLGAALVLLAMGRTWAEGRTGAGQAALPVSVTGREVTAVPAALALAGLAALVAVFAVRRAGRVAVSVLLALCGAGAVAASVAGAADRQAVDAAAAAATGLSDATASGVSHTAWPWMAALGGLLMLAAGLVAVVRSRRWPGMSARYDAPGSRTRPHRPAPSADADRPDEMWKALDRGEDPTDR